MKKILSPGIALVTDNGSRMKNLFLLVAFGMLCFTGYAQSRSDKMYDHLSGYDGVTHFLFSKNMTDAFNINLGGDEDDKQVTGHLTKIRFMSYNPEKGNLSGDQFLGKAIDYLPKSVYKKYEDEESHNDDAEIWLMGKRDKYQECHVFIQNNNQNGLRFVVSFFGDFLVKDIEGLKKAGKEFSDE